MGQEVAALVGGGAYAEVVLADAGAVHPLPRGLDLRTAATLPTVLPTAHALIHEVGRLRAGESVLVHGAAGGIGTAVGQLARAAGAGAVYGVASTEAKAAYALKYGYDEVFRPETFAEDVRRATGGRGVDLVLDPVGGDTLRRGLESLAVFGRLVSFGNAGGDAPWQVGQPELYGQGHSVSGFSVLSLAQTAPAAARALTERALRAVSQGTVTLPVTADSPGRRGRSTPAPRRARLHGQAAAAREGLTAPARPEGLRRARRGPRHARGAAASSSAMLPDMIVRTCSVMCSTGQSHQATARSRATSSSSYRVRMRRAGLPPTIP
ncbi:hypothetical protein STANM309S_02694 [Streptomyces tanashiensis]